MRGLASQADLDDRSKRSNWKQCERPSSQPRIRTGSEQLRSGDRKHPSREAAYKQSSREATAFVSPARECWVAGRRRNEARQGRHYAPRKAANPLFWKILPVNHLQSRFCEGDSSSVPVT